jgi:SAM-dependent methyltransferase
LIKCKSCGIEMKFQSNSYICESCKAVYTAQGGVFVFLDKQKNTDNEFYPEDAFERMQQLEDYFWFRGRNKIIGNALLHFLPDKKSTVLEVGCGNGYVSSYIKDLGYDLSCSDLSMQALQNCKKMNSKGSYYQFDLCRIPFEGHFDCICAFDVLEHLDDKLAISNIHTALKKNGLLLITVPAHMALWSKTDELAKHKRRYNQQKIKEKLEDNGFITIKSSHFMTLLLPFIFFSRLILKKNAYDEFKIHPLLNELFLRILELESHLINHLSLPIGSSIICLAKKKANDCEN